jgi:hypothetical protein
MRSGNPLDGAYFFLLFGPFVLSICLGDILRRKIIGHLLLDRFESHNISTFVGFSAQILIMIIGVLAGYFLTKLI